MRKKLEPTLDLFLAGSGPLDGRYRNVRCLRCNSNRKYKHCHLYLDEGWRVDAAGHWVDARKEHVAAV